MSRGSDRSDTRRVVPRREKSVDVSRRSLIIAGGAIGVAVGGGTYALLEPDRASDVRRPRSAPSGTGDEMRPIPLTTRPPELVDPIVVDLTDLDPGGPLPGWDGAAPSQSSAGLFPQDRDLKILGHSAASWRGGGFIRGGRNVHWIGGRYARGPWLRNFTGDGCVEGALVRHSFSPEGTETGDGVTLAPDSTTLGRSDISVLNCRVENIDGLLDAGHGDCFQLPSAYDAPDGYSSTPRTATIERFTGTTGYQGLFLANQHFDSLGYEISCELVRLIDVNLRKTRPQIMRTEGVPREGNVRLLYLVDLTAAARGDRPYPRQFHNVHLEPWADEGLDGCIAPYKTAGPLGYSDPSLGPVVSKDGRSATFPPELLVTGEVQLGPPAAGDFARSADSLGRGGLDVPGIAYESPGYGPRN